MQKDKAASCISCGKFHFRTSSISTELYEGGEEEGKSSSSSVDDAAISHLLWFSTYTVGLFYIIFQAYITARHFQVEQVYLSLGLTDFMRNL